MLEAFQAAALTVDRDINAVCDFILEAREWALQLETVAETERGALYGLPFSVKVETLYFTIKKAFRRNYEKKWGWGIKFG